MTGINLKEKRKQLGLYQSELAEILGVSSNTINNYEAGKKIPSTKISMLKAVLEELEKKLINADRFKAFLKDQNFTPEDFAKMAHLPVKDVICFQNGISIPKSKLIQLRSFIDLYNQESQAVEVEDSVYKTMLIPLVSKYDRFNYLTKFNNEDWIDKLPKISCNKEQEGDSGFLTFQMNGEGMNNETSASFLDGDLLLCKGIEKQYWKTKFNLNKSAYVIIHKTKGILINKIINHDLNLNTITLHSLNIYIEDVTVNLNEVYQIFSVKDLKRVLK